MEQIFEGFPKIARLNRECTVTEKLNGTNSLIEIKDDGTILTGSRNRWITPQDDNYGFARWVERNKKELLQLGPGRHFGEWWGLGIQRGYGLKEKCFSLFNTFRWDSVDRPGCCHVVPVLYKGLFDTQVINELVSNMKNNGSYAVPGFLHPEGVVIYNSALNGYFKVTCEKDDKPKNSTE